MQTNIKYWAHVALVAFSVTCFAACSDDDDNNSTSTELTAQQTAFKTANKMFVETTVQPTYEGLAKATGEMRDALEAFDKTRTQSDLDAAAAAWKSARQYWEWSEAFLFGAATGYGIDPHIDTWPFDAAAFSSYMSKYTPSTNESDAAILEEAIATGQNLTGFHAVEYLLFRTGEVRTASDITDDELWFAIAATEDLYWSAIKLVASWNGDLSSADEAYLEDELEFEHSDFGEEFVTAGEAGSRWKTVILASQQIIEGCQDIIDEVAANKIGFAYTGDDTNYIESPHAYNSITDFYDNIMSCKNALYGLAPSTASYNVSVPAAGSLFAVTAFYYSAETTKAMAALKSALAAVNNMKRPFVLYYTDATAGTAIEALENLDDALNTLKEAMSE